MNETLLFQIFASGRTQYAGQGLGLVVAKTREIAVAAAKLVVVQYSDYKKPVVTIREAIKHKDRVVDPLNIYTGVIGPDVVEGEQDISKFTCIWESIRKMKREIYLF